LVGACAVPSGGQVSDTCEMVAWRRGESRGGRAGHYRVKRPDPVPAWSPVADGSRGLLLALPAELEVPTFLQAALRKAMQRASRYASCRSVPRLNEDQRNDERTLT
jgi:hypothetical protein